MWVARRNARLYTFAFADVFQPDIRRTPVCRHVILREEGGTTLGEGEKGEKRSEGKGKMNRTGRPWISNSSCRSCYLLSKGITCQRTQLSSAIDTSVSIYERLPEVTADEFLFETLERERERETVSPRESSFIVRDSVPRERERKYKVRFILWVSIRNGNGYSAFRKDFVLHRIELRKK